MLLDDLERLNERERLAFADQVENEWRAHPVRDWVWPYQVLVSTACGDAPDCDTENVGDGVGRGGRTGVPEVESGSNKVVPETVCAIPGTCRLHPSTPEATDVSILRNVPPAVYMAAP